MLDRCIIVCYNVFVINKRLQTKKKRGFKNGKKI